MQVDEIRHILRIGEIMKEQQVNLETLDRCPRCRGFIPNNATPDKYPGAVSRRTRGSGETMVMVCSECGTEEAMEEFETGSCTPMGEWPIMEVNAANRRNQALDIIAKIVFSRYTDRSRYPKNKNK